VSCTIDEERHEILVHALNCDDPAQMAAEIKSRYETPLLEIFEAVRPTDAAIQGDRA
jgi:multicomponent K+:H+ antiporter subunit E